MIVDSISSRLVRILVNVLCKQKIIKDGDHLLSSAFTILIFGGNVCLVC
jgi:hypothetical protein